MPHLENELAHKYHFVGIGGIGMSGLARLLLQNGKVVSGSDISTSEMISDLQSLGASISIGHDPKNVPEGASLVVSSSVSEKNQELCFARNACYPVLHRSDLLHLLMCQTKSLLIAGTHGKTTTTSLLAAVFLRAGLKKTAYDPSYAIGGVLKETGLNASYGRGEYFIAEADESDGTFLKYSPYGAIITNVDDDHMDYYGNQEALCSAMKNFASKVAHKEFLFHCNDDENLRRCELEGVSYGFLPHADLQGLNFRHKGESILFDVSFEGHLYRDLEVNLKGKHNALNALAVFGLAIKVGISEDAVREAFSQFKGVKRRVEVVGESQGVRIIDDYAHHPTEVDVTLKGLKAAHPNRRLIALFQPHRYSRVKNCLEEFGSCFDFADEVIVTDIYSAGETPIDGVHAEDIVKEASRRSSISIRYIPKEDLVDWVARFLSPFDVVVTLGAGDITREGRKILKKLVEHPLKPIKCALIFGGSSPEHDISLLSAQNVAKGLDPKLYAVSHFYISKSGYWTEGKEAFEVLESQKSKEIKADKILSSEVVDALQRSEIAFPMLHGSNGEDGTIQGMFDMFFLPYVGCDHQASAVTMDKVLTKKLAESSGLAVAPYVDFSRHLWLYEKERMWGEIESKLKFPLYVKPVHLGSTVGVKRVEAKEDLFLAIDDAFLYDRHVLVETTIKGRELEFSLFGNGFLRAFPPGEIMNQGAIYDYAAKYGEAPFQTASIADLDAATTQRGIDFAVRAYQSVGCDGYARVDCFLDEAGHFILNEINSIPGFTAHSLFPKMCEAHGVKLPDLLNELILWGFERQRQRLKYICDSVKA